ncbi:MAG: ROK family protein, partial [Candidatus Rokuibacteriota bacterium]
MAADGVVVSRAERLTEARRGPAAVLESLEDLIRELGVADGVGAIGVACAGQIDPATGTVVYSPNLDWRDVPLAATLTRAFRLPVTVENDVRAAAWGEFTAGAGRG